MCVKSEKSVCCVTAYSGLCWRSHQYLVLKQEFIFPTGIFKNEPKLIESRLLQTHSDLIKSSPVYQGQSSSLQSKYELLPDVFWSRMIRSLKSSLVLVVLCPHMPKVVAKTHHSDYIFQEMNHLQDFLAKSAMKESVSLSLFNMELKSDCYMAYFHLLSLLSLLYCFHC